VFSSKKYLTKFHTTVIAVGELSKNTVLALPRFKDVTNLRTPLIVATGIEPGPVPVASLT